MKSNQNTIALYFFALSLFVSSCGPGKVFSPTVTPIPTDTLRKTTAPTLTTPPTFSPTAQRGCKPLGDRQVVVSKLDRDRMNLKWWPDGIMGVLHNNTGYEFFVSNGGQIAKTAGNLDNPISGTIQPFLAINNMKNKYQYAGGGPIYRDTKTGNLLMFYHAEKWPNGTENQQFYSLVGMAKSTDGGNTWNDLGEIVTPEIHFGENNDAVEVEGAPFVVAGDYLYVYFADYLASGELNNLAIARAKVQDVVKTANESNGVVPWFKLYKGAWNEPGLGGRSSPLENGNPETRWFDVSFNEYLGMFIMVVSAQNSNTNKTNLYLNESIDGLVWGSRELIENEPGESFYATIVGSGSDPHVSGQQFYIYYTFSIAGEGDRWNDAVLARRLISCSN